MALHIYPEQCQERNEEMAENNDQPDIPPGSLFTDHIPERLFRHITVPNNKVLRKSDVGVEHSEGEHQGANEIILVFVQNVGQHPLPIQDHRDDISRRQHQPYAACEVINAVHCGEPFVLQGFHPHDDCKGQCYRIKPDSNSSIAAHPISR